MGQNNSRVGILMGSDSDLEIMKEAVQVLEDFSVPHEVAILSAHRSPKKTIRYAESAEERGISVLIAGAGHAAHLAGVVAAHTTLPVIGVPIDSSSLKGLDSLLSTVQMPPGVPVACMGIGKAGAKNAALLACEILAVGDPTVRGKLKKHRDEMEKAVEAGNQKLKNIRS